MRNFTKQFGPGILHFVIWTSFLYLPVASSASTATAFSNFGAGMSYNTGNGNIVGNAFDGNTYAEADSFKSPVTGPMLSIQLALSCAFACPASFTISLDQNSGGQPGAVLESFTYAGTSLGSLGSNNALVSLTSVLHPILTDGSTYWMVVQADPGDTDSIAWNFNTVGDSSIEDVSLNNGVTWSVSGFTPGAYQVSATIPEPGSIGLLLAGGMLLAFFGIKRRIRTAALKTGASIMVALSLGLLVPARSFAASWTPLTNTALGGAGVMILLTDGTVMIQNGSSANWMQLTPDATGSYINGTWTALAPMILDRLYFTAQVLPSGKVWVLGGEYSGPFLDANITPFAEIYDPVANSWSPAAAYPTEAGATHCGTRTVTSNAAETTTSNVLMGIYSTALMQVGWTVTGTGIPTGTTITSIDSATQVHISNAATVTATNELTFRGQTLACFGDDPSMLLPSGNILAGNIFNNSTYTYSVATDSWSFTANKFYNDRSDEEGWAKQADDTVLTYDLFQAVAAGNGYAEIFNPYTQTWYSITPSDGHANGVLPVLSSSALGDELGPTLRLQDGRVFQIGANQHTALYTPSTNTWVAGPDMIGTLTNSQGTVNANFGADDAPAAVLPNGHVILAADAGPASVITTGNVTSGSPTITNIPSTAGLQVGWTITGRSGTTTIISSTIKSVDSATQVTANANATGTGTPATITFGGTFSRPVELFDFNPSTNTLAPVSPAIPDTSLTTKPSYVTRMLVLPNGQLLFSDDSNQLYVYTADGSPSTSVRPMVNNVAYSGGGVFTLTGKQLNGQNAGSTYGDDAQYDENYPIVRLQNASGNVFYCRTTNWSNYSVGNPNPETVNFTLNSAVTPGNYILTVSGAGIQSLPIFVNITAAAVAKQ